MVQRCTLALWQSAKVCRNTLTSSTPPLSVVHKDTQMYTLSGLPSHRFFAPFLQVTASFSLSRLSSGVPLLGSEFSCDVARGKVAPGESLRSTVTYTPAVVDTVSVEYLSLKCRGALNETLLKLTGNCVGKGHTENTHVYNLKIHCFNLRKTDKCVNH